MNTYKIVNGVNGKFHIARGPREDFELFSGYDFMGSDNWSKSWNDAEAFDSIDEAKQIISDLEAADEPADPEDPAKKQYMVQIRFDGEVFCKMMTGRELADRYEYEAEAGIGEEYAAYDVSRFGDPVRINVYELVSEILDQKRWMDQEYRDYCEAVNEYGYDFESC